MVVRVNVAVELPAATVTLAGTIAEELLLDSATGLPPVGAGAFSVTVPVDELPPTTIAGFIATATSVAPWPAARDKVTLEFAAMETLSCN